jgi:hypothetical protein
MLLLDDDDRAFGLKGGEFDDSFVDIIVAAMTA